MPSESQREAAVAVAAAASRSRGRLVAQLAQRTRDLALAEDALADAFERALRTWPTHGVPASPEAWLLTVARRRQIDILRSSAQRTAAPFDEGAHGSIDSDQPLTADPTLGVLFACAHPAIAATVRTPLLLAVVFGFEVEPIARAFHVPTSTMAQRLVRAKRRIRDAGIPIAVPPPSDRAPRVPAVLEAIYGAFAIDWLEAHPDNSDTPADQARWLAVLLAAELGDDPEAWGLAALITLASARAGGRVGSPWPPLLDQDTTLWSRELIAEGEALLRRASALGRPLGRFQLEAAIQSVHCDRARSGVLDEATLLALYRGLVAIAPTEGAVRALAAVEADQRGSS